MDVLSYDFGIEVVAEEVVQVRFNWLRFMEELLVELFLGGVHEDVATGII